MFKLRLQPISHGVIALLALSLIPVGSKPTAAQSYKPVTEHREALSAEPLSGVFVLQQDDGNVVCRDAASEESEILNARDESISLQIISPLRANEITPAEAGLQIILRGTPQLENFPQAKNAFLRAAETWENLIQTPITVIIDVDFGPRVSEFPIPPQTYWDRRSLKKSGVRRFILKCAGV
jgi:hypothetical protein